jgi:GNAT superfamily N-acetyltransferase
MTVEIRTARADDLPQLRTLLRQLATATTDPSAYEFDAERAADVWREIESQPGRTLLVADDAGRVVGTLDLVVVPNLTHDARPWAIVENIVVDAGHRRCGIGHALLNDALVRARGAGCYKVQLLSRRERTEAHEFYGALGFEHSAAGFRLYL